MGTRSCRVSIILLSVGLSTISVDTFVAFWSARVRSAGLVADIVSQVLLKSTCYLEEHRSLGGSITSRLDNGAFVGLIYELLFFSYFHVEVVPPVTTHAYSMKCYYVPVWRFLQRQWKNKRMLK